MPSMLSSFIATRKQLLSCGRGVPALKSVGDACVNQRSDMSLYVSHAASMSVLWMPIATRMSMCCGLSTMMSLRRSR